jgi:hypothetical protein
MFLLLLMFVLLLLILVVLMFLLLLLLDRIHKFSSFIPIIYRAIWMTYLKDLSHEFGFGRA